MAAPLRLTLLVSGGIGGDLAQLPRLHTWLQRLRTAEGLCLLLDQGGACQRASWHCRATGGRSTYIVLDGMGYHAANVAGVLEPSLYDSFAAQLTMALVGSGRAWQARLPGQPQLGIDICLETRAGKRLQLLLQPAPCTRLDGNILQIGAVKRGEIARIRLQLGVQPQLLDAERLHMAPRLPPSPSIAGTVEFVEAEARLKMQQRS